MNFFYKKECITYVYILYATSNKDTLQEYKTKTPPPPQKNIMYGRPVMQIEIIL